jgi:hypothetical protein
MQPSNQQTNASNLASNTTGAPYEMYTATFGNMNFAIAPSMTGEVSNTFGTLPYVSLESVIYAQQMQAQVSPTNIVSGQNTGQQNIQGSTTIQDSNGLNRMVMGYSQSGF